MQIQLMSELVEDDQVNLSDISRKTQSLKQSFPFTGAHMPPTVTMSSVRDSTQPPAPVSPGLQMLTTVLIDAMDELSYSQLHSLKQLISRIVATFHMFFLQWTVGLGFEPQLNYLASLVGLPKSIQERENSLDYTLMIRPQKVVETLTLQKFDHAEDFFFRSVHLGTDCWAFISTYYLKKAFSHATNFEWSEAVGLIMQVSRIFNYLGDHVMMLTAMVLRDYLDLKVEVEGTSGEGSVLVKSFKYHVRQLQVPLYKGLCSDEDNNNNHPNRDGVGDDNNNSNSNSNSNSNPAFDIDSDQTFQERLVMIYSSPEMYPSLYAYAKALETVESSLLGGFYYKHYMLANNVIGSMAKGTMNKSVKALRSTYEVLVFPVLDRVRSDLGATFTANNTHRKGRIMNDIEMKRKYGKDYVSPTPMNTPKPPTAPHPNTNQQSVDNVSAKLRRLDQKRVSGGGPMGRSRLRLGLGTRENSWSTTSKSELSDHPNSYPDDEFKESERDYCRRKLFCDRSVPKNLLLAKDEMCAENNAADLSFHSHAFGMVPPNALVNANRRIYALYAGLANDSWETIFMSEIPRAQAHIRTMVGLDSDGPESIEFGHNSHELVTKIMSTVLDRLITAYPNPKSNPSTSPVASAPPSPLPFRILTTDTEFYSITRQLNRLLSLQSSLVNVEVVPAEPTDTFEERFRQTLEASEAGFDFIYCSVITYTQLTLIRDLPIFVAGLNETIARKQDDAVADANPNKNSGYRNTIIIDAYHSFAAMPVCIKGMNAIYLAGSLKHACAGANLAFAILPSSQADLEPLITGWLADQSVLYPGSCGVKIRDKVGYTPGFRLMSSTPAIGYPLVTFNMVMDDYVKCGMSVKYTHDHVIRLHRRFLEGLTQLEANGHCCRFISLETLRKPLADEAVRSHVLVFNQVTFEDAAECCRAMRKHSIGIDSRKTYVRVGFGLNHNSEDVDRLLECLRDIK